LPTLSLSLNSLLYIIAAHEIRQYGRYVDRESDDADLEVIVKNSGKTFPVQVDVNGSASEFKSSISTATGVPLGESICNRSPQALLIPFQSE
jgi:hypothetical protein